MLIKNKRELERAKKRLEKLKAIKQAYEEDNKSCFWRPFPHQQKIIDLLWAGKKTLLLQGANRIGKTVLGANLCGSFALGKQLWDGKPSIFEGRPTKGRIICSSWETHAQDVVVPVLREWIPKNTYTTKSNNLGVEAVWKFDNGSIFELITHTQDTKVMEGWKGDWVWADEPLPKDKYNVNKRGLIDSNGVFLLTMTALYEDWIYDEFVLKNDPSIGRVMEVPMTANPFLDKEAIRQFSLTLSNEEIKARIEGKWYQLEDRICQDFDPTVHCIKPFKVPFDYPVIAQIDSHLSLPHAIGFYTWDKRDIMFVIDEIWDKMTPEEIAYRIIDYKNKNNWNLRQVFIDPLAKGDTTYIKNLGYYIEDTYSVIERKLGQEGIILNTASKDKPSGIRNINERLRGYNGIPTLYIFDKCEQHIKQLQRWKYENGKPVKEDDHFCECLYRATLTGIKYGYFDIYKKPLKIPELGLV